MRVLNRVGWPGLLGVVGLLWCCGPSGPEGDDGGVDAAIDASRTGPRGTGMTVTRPIGPAGGPHHLLARLSVRARGARVCAARHGLVRAERRLRLAGGVLVACRRRAR